MRNTKGVYVRAAKLQDAETILQWRNDPETRKHSFSKDIISFETHMKWFREKLADNNCYLYILMDGEECVGQLRIEKAGNIGKISYMVAPEKRKRGYGRELLTLAEAVVPENVRVLVGFVETQNEPSKRCFRGKHYAEFKVGEMNCFIKLL